MGLGNQLVNGTYPCKPDVGFGMDFPREGVDEEDRLHRAQMGLEKWWLSVKGLRSGRRVTGSW